MSLDTRGVQIANGSKNLDDEHPNDIQVNGLPINAAEFEAELHLIEYFKTDVIRGEEAFLIIAEGFNDFERAMREKLLMEIYPNAFLAKSN